MAVGNAVGNITIELTVVLGTSVMRIHQLLKMGRGAVIELDAKEDDPVTILANGQPIARGEVVVSGERIGVSITDTILSSAR